MTIMKHRISPLRLAISLSLLTAICITALAEYPQRRYFDRHEAIADTLMILTEPSKSGSFDAFEIVAAPEPGIAKRQSVAYGIAWGSRLDDSLSVRYEALLQQRDSDPHASDAIIDNRYVALTLTRISDGRHEIIFTKDLTENISRSMTDNALAVEIGNDTVTILAGLKNLEPIHSTLMPASDSIQWGIIAHGAIRFPLAVAETYVDRALTHDTGLSETRILDYHKSSQSPEGIYSYLDRDNDPMYARQGGTYRLLLKSDGQNGYLIIYVDGARINRQMWHTGMIKGRLTPTPFAGHYNLRWYDASLNEIAEESSATLDNSILTLSFPLLKTQMRFSLQPKDN